MNIEIMLREYLDEQLSVDVSITREDLSGEFVFIEKVGGSMSDQLMKGSFAFKSYADQLERAIEIDKMVRDAMEEAPDEIDINSAYLASNYNHTDTQKKKYRYQSVFDITYFE